MHVSADILQTVWKVSQYPLKTVPKSLTQGSSLGLVGIENCEAFLSYLSNPEILRIFTLIEYFTLYKHFPFHIHTLLTAIAFMMKMRLRGVK